MKVLIVGMQIVPNQFTRAMDSYEGVTWEHVDSDPNGHIPRCDAAILTTCQLSHEKFYQAKALMKASGKPFFVTHSSFSRIKQDFEDLLKAQGMEVKIKAALKPPRKVTINGQLGNALKEAIKEVTPPKADAAMKLETDIATVSSILPNPGPRDTPSQASFEQAVSRLFTTDPVLSSQLRQFFFGGISSDGYAELGIRVSERHIGEHIRDDKVAMQKILGVLGRAWGFDTVKGVRIMLAYRKALYGEALYKLALNWQSEGLNSHEIVKRLERENYHKPSNTPWQANDITSNRSFYRKKQGEYSLKNSLKNLPSKAPLPPPAKVVKIEPPVVLPPQFAKPKEEVKVVESAQVPAPPPQPQPHVATSKEEMIAKVIGLKDMDAVKKIQLIEEINAGIRTVEYQVIAERKGELLQLTAQSIFHPEDKCLLQMTRALAKDIVMSFDTIKNFAGGDA